MVIENTIIKIGVLLVLGFGEAGSEIICSNFQENKEMDSVMLGKKVVGIFGFCDIRNFTDTTEELQEGVMKFVNELAQIIHGLTSKYFGAANKNIGDAFLIVWKFSPEDFYVEDEVIMRNSNSKKSFYIPDMSLLSFLKILAKVNKDPNVLKYRTYQKLLQRMPNYEVKLGFGLHMGWAIEGAIGSQFKVDASYLSPHVNLASSLEATTKIYGVPILISGALYDIFSEDVQKYCRKIDAVTIKGTSKPISLYTSDCDFSHFTLGQFTSRRKELYIRKNKSLKKRLEKGEVTTGQLFANSHEIELMRRNFSADFFTFFKTGMKFYLLGEWVQAKTYLEKSLDLKNKDGPSLCLQNFISEYNFKCPTFWKHYRPLG
jgi:class 3 adenylate cyclase